MIRFDRVRLAGLALAAVAVSLAGCATPLGPGFLLHRETVTVHYAPRPAAPAVYYHLQVDARNVGNRPLDLLRIRAPRPLVSTPPEDQTTASASKRSRMDGLPVPLEPPLGQRRSRRIVFGYLVPIRAETVFLEPQDWFPSFLPPHGLFAKSVPRATETEVDISVPSGDRALTSGQLRRVRGGPGGAGTEYVFQVGQRDFPPFLLIGNFDVDKVRARGQDVFFWTNKPFPSACAKTVADEAVETTRLYRSLFGRLEENAGPLRMIEMPPRTQASGPSETMPNGVLFFEGPTEVCRQSRRFYFILARALAATWFGWAVQPDPGADAILGNGVRNYAALLAEENQDGEGERKQQVMDWIAEYDRLSSRTQPLTPSNPGTHPTDDQRRMAGVQSALFFVALEDRLGAAPLRNALRDLVSSLDGSTAGRNELRSAVERASGGNLYDFFNQWLDRAGIPASFRRCYSASESTPDFGKHVALLGSQEEK